MMDVIGRGGAEGLCGATATQVCRCGRCHLRSRLTNAEVAELFARADAYQGAVSLGAIEALERIIADPPPGVRFDPTIRHLKGAVKLLRADLNYRGSTSRPSTDLGGSKTQ